VHLTKCKIREFGVKVENDNDVEEIIEGNNYSNKKLTLNM